MKKVSMLSTVAAVAVAGASLASTASVFAYGDNSGINGGRPGYTMAQINSGVLGNNVVFNSITDGQYTDNAGKVHQLGDERNFVRTRLSNTHNVWSSNEIVAEDGKEYVLSLYVHNDNPNGTAVVAENTKVSFSIPGNTDTSIEVNGYISASNANPSKYWDNVVFKSADGSKFHLEYVAGSALWEGNGAAAGQLSDALVSADGVLVGYNSLDGKLPGCYEYSGYASARVKVVYDYAFTIQKQVRIKGTTDWKDEVEAKIGDTLEFMITYKNVSGQTVSNVMVQDSLPTNMQYIAGSTKLANANHQQGVVVSDGLTEQGINIGDYANNAKAYVMFEAKVINKTLACEKKNQLVNWVKITAGNVTRKDYASVMLPKTCEGKTPEDLPDTGATSIVAAGALGAGAVVTALGYAISSRKKLM